MKKTKIICTLGPATDNDQVLADMIKVGMDVARFNFSHGDYDAQSKRLEQLIRVREAQGVPCLLYTSPSPRDRQKSRMPSSA